MKKVLITMAVLASMVAGVMVLSSFTTAKQVVNNECVQLSVNVPAYWEGGACCSGSSNDYLYIEVYQTEGQCNSYYAVVTGAYLKSNVGKELWVKDNPNYDPDDRWGSCGKKKYYVSCGDRDYFFNM